MLSYIQIVLAVILSALVLIQQSEGSLGAAFGGSGMDATHRTRRGPELWIFRGTMVIAILFVASTLLNLADVISPHKKIGRKQKNCSLPLPFQMFWTDPHRIIRSLFKVTPKKFSFMIMLDIEWFCNIFLAAS